MNKHAKVAIISAPFLAIGGFVATEYYVQYKHSGPKLYKLSINNGCNFATNKCELMGAGLTLKLSDTNSKIRVVSNYPLDMVTISILNEKTEELIYRMENESDRQHWMVVRDNASDNPHLSSPLTMRISAVVGNAFYISEFKAIYPTDDL